MVRCSWVRLEHVMPDCSRQAVPIAVFATMLVDSMWQWAICCCSRMVCPAIYDWPAGDVALRSEDGLNSSLKLLSATGIQVCLVLPPWKTRLGC